MAIISMTFNFNNINTSAQVGDIVYFSYNGQSLGGFDTTDLQFTKMLGPITIIDGDQITVEYDNTVHPNGVPAGAFISFVKDKSVNTSSLLGYYASVNFINNSTKKAELFSVGSEISQSSK
jgi:hypothetical protein